MNPPNSEAFYSGLLVSYHITTWCHNTQNHNFIAMKTSDIIIQPNFKVGISEIQVQSVMPTLTFSVSFVA